VARDHTGVVVSVQHLELELGVGQQVGVGVDLLRERGACVRRAGEREGATTSEG